MGDAGISRAGSNRQVFLDEIAFDKFYFLLSTTAFVKFFLENSPCSKTGI